MSETAKSWIDKINGWYKYQDMDFKDRDPKNVLRERLLIINSQAVTFYGVGPAVTGTRFSIIDQLMSVIVAAVIVSSVAL